MSPRGRAPGRLAGVHGSTVRLRVLVDVERYQHSGDRPDRCGVCPLSYGRSCLAFDAVRDEVREWRGPEYVSDYVRLDACRAAEERMFSYSGTA